MPVDGHPPGSPDRAPSESDRSRGVWPGSRVRQRLHQIQSDQASQFGRGALLSVLLGGDGGERQGRAGCGLGLEEVECQFARHGGLQANGSFVVTPGYRRASDRIRRSSVERAIGPDTTVTLDFALNRLAGEHPGRLHVLPLDVADARSRDALLHELPLVTDEEPLHLLVNNAGVLRGGERFGHVTAADLDVALHAVDVMTSILKAGETGQVITLSTTCERPAALGPDEARALLR